MGDKIHGGPVSATVVLRFADGTEITWDVHEGHAITSNVTMDYVEPQRESLFPPRRISRLDHKFQLSISASSRFTQDGVFVTRTNGTWRDGDEFGLSGTTTGPVSMGIEER